MTFKNENIEMSQKGYCKHWIRIRLVIGFVTS